MSKKKTVVVALDNRDDIAAFLHFIKEKANEPMEFVFSNIHLPNYTTDESILVIGDILNTYVYSMYDHEVIGLYRLINLDALFFTGMADINRIIKEYGFFHVEFIEMAIRLASRVKLAKKYDAKDIVIGVPPKYSSIATIFVEYFSKLGYNIILSDTNNNIVDEFVKENEIQEYDSYPTNYINGFEDEDINYYSDIFITKEIYPYIDKILSSDIFSED